MKSIVHVVEAVACALRHLDVNRVLRSTARRPRLEIERHNIEKHQLESKIVGFGWPSI